jgi:hypothetical protein
MAPHGPCAFPRIVTSVEMFSDVTICQANECRVVQIVNRWWIYDDGSYVLSMQDPDNPMRGSTHSGHDAGGRAVLETRTDSMWKLADQAAVR